MELTTSLSKIKKDWPILNWYVFSRYIDIYIKEDVDTYWRYVWLCLTNASNVIISGVVWQFRIILPHCWAVASPQSIQRCCRRYYLVTFKKVYLKAAAFVPYQILILHVCHVSPGSPRRVPWPPGAVPAVHPPRVGVRHVAQLQLETRVNTNTGQHVARVTWSKQRRKSPTSIHHSPSVSK